MNDTTNENETHTTTNAPAEANERDYEIFGGRDGFVKSWTRGVPIDDASKKQLLQTASMPFVHKWVAAMPDVHVGLGATVGSVIAMKRAVIPAAVGVDLGCGMVAARTTLVASDLPDHLGGVRTALEAAIPHGRTDHGGPNDRGAWRDPPAGAVAAWQALSGDWARLCERHPKLARGATAQHLGTLGTGNHFVELCLDEAQRVWVMLHSGSRGLGHRIGSHFIELAKEDMRRYHVVLPNEDLAYLPEGSRWFDDYWAGVDLAQRFARQNRVLMLEAALAALGRVGLPPFTVSDEAVNCHHNYVAREHHYGEQVYVTRKGAVRARKDDLGIIPGSMGARSFIVRGKGNPESFHSCSHGAGRLMSRAEAKRRFSVEDHARATAAVECRKDAEVVDETPAAYKPIEAVMAAQRSLVDVVHELKQVVCVKG